MEQTITAGKLDVLQEKEKEGITYCLCELRILKGCFYSIYVQGNGVCAMEVLGDDAMKARCAWETVRDGGLSPVHLHDWVCDFRRQFDL